jgi:hypothetical protein
MYGGGPQGGNMKEKSDDTHRAGGARATELRGVWNRAFCSERPGYQSCTSHTADREYSNDDMSDQLRRAGNDLPEFLPSDHRRDGSKSYGASEWHLQSQLHYSAACLQTAVLKGHLGTTHPSAWPAPLALMGSASRLQGGS